MTSIPPNPATGPVEPTTLDPLTVARANLASFCALPQIEASWINRRDGYLDQARTCALVSIAESLATIAARLEAR